MSQNNEQKNRAIAEISVKHLKLVVAGEGWSENRLVAVVFAIPNDGGVGDVGGGSEPLANDSDGCFDGSKRLEPGDCFNA